MIRESLEKPYFKEKLRGRTYDASPQADSQVFLEIKKKVCNGKGSNSGGR